jgi:hypothetical protein
MPQTLQDSALGTRLAASFGVAKRAFSFSLRWSATNAKRMRMRNRMRTPRRLSPRCTASGASMCSTDYLVICGRASARPMDPASASMESPLDSRKDIIAQLLCLMQRSLMPEFQVSASSVHQSGFGVRRAEDNSLTSGLPTILELARASSASTVIVHRLNHLFVLCPNPESQC